jgi:uncharacterized protein (DUF2147 family)
MHFIKFIAAFTALGAAMAATAQNTPVGKWNSVDDKTKEVKSEITITEANGALSGKITKLLSKTAKQDAVCDKCSDARKDKPMIGLEIIRGGKKEAEADVWTGGKILDPESGKEYSLKLTPKDGGAKLDVRGSIGPFGRTQTWVRAQ